VKSQETTWILWPWFAKTFNWSRILLMLVHLYILLKLTVSL